MRSVRSVNYCVLDCRPTRPNSDGVDGVRSKLERSLQISNTEQDIQFFALGDNSQQVTDDETSVADICQQAENVTNHIHCGSKEGGSTIDRCTLPPDLISASSCASLDDSVSSISSSNCSFADDSDNQPSPTRTIFKDFWQANREQKPFSYVKPSLVDRPRASALNSLERFSSIQNALSVREEKQCPGNEAKSGIWEERAKRRTIFGDLRQSHFYSSVQLCM